MKHLRNYYSFQNEIGTENFSSIVSQQSFSICACTHAMYCIYIYRVAD